MKKSRNNFTPKRKAGPADKAMNAIIAVLIIAVLALAVVAVTPKFKAKYDEKKQEEQANLPDTISKRADEKNMSVEDFISEYGITGDNLSGETMMSDVIPKMTIENYAKLTDTTADDYIAQNNLPADKVTGATTMEEADKLIPIKTVIASSGMDFETFKTTYGLGDDVTEDTAWADVQEQVMAAVQAQQAAAQTDTNNGTDSASEESTDASADAGADTASADAEKAGE